MNDILSDKHLQTLIKRIVIALVIGLFVILVIIPGIQNSDFAKLKEYDGDIREDLSLKKKQQLLKQWQYDTHGGIESTEEKIYRVGDFTVNVRGDIDRKLTLNISLQYVDEDAPRELQNKNPIIRNSVISTCTDAEYLESKHGKELLKENLKRNINQSLNKEAVSEVYFNHFLIQ